MKLTNHHYNSIYSSNYKKPPEQNKHKIPKITTPLSQNRQPAGQSSELSNIKTM